MRSSCRLTDAKRALICSSPDGKIGWGGRIRTFTIHINSVVSYRLDHAPAVFAADLRPNGLGRLRRVGRDGGFF
jgi:hypothetical protein